LGYFGLKYYINNTKFIIIKGKRNSKTNGGLFSRISFDQAPHPFSTYPLRLSSPSQNPRSRETLTRARARETRRQAAAARRTAGDVVVQESNPKSRNLNPIPAWASRSREKEWAKSEPRRPVTGDTVVGDETARASDKLKTLDPLCLPHPNAQTPKTLIPCLNST